jgi:hypothetical protein
MSSEQWNEALEEQYVTYIIELEGTITVIEHVPARVNIETGERFFAPETVEKIRAILKTKRAPSKMVEAPVFDFAA